MLSSNIIDNIFRLSESRPHITFYIFFLFGENVYI